MVDPLHMNFTCSCFSCIQRFERVGIQYVPGLGRVGIPYTVRRGVWTLNTSTDFSARCLKEWVSNIHWVQEGVVSNTHCVQEWVSNTHWVQEWVSNTHWVQEEWASDTLLRWGRASVQYTLSTGRVGIWHITQMRKSECPIHIEYRKSGHLTHYSDEEERVSNTYWAEGRPLSWERADDSAAPTDHWTLTFPQKDERPY